MVHFLTTFLLFAWNRCLAALSMLLTIVPSSLSHLITFPHRTPHLPLHPAISHLLFANDLVRFSQAPTTSATSVINVFNDLQLLSGQRKNIYESKFLFSKSVFLDLQTTLTHMLNISPSICFGKYLSFYHANLPPKICIYQFIIDRINTKLSGWKGRFLGFSG